MGSGTSSRRAGEIWHFLDIQLGYPATLIHAEQINSIDLSDYQVLILPSGSYSQVLDSSAIEKIGAWTGSGGTDRKSTRLNSSHVAISYAVFCLKKQNHYTTIIPPRLP